MKLDVDLDLDLDKIRPDWIRLRLYLDLELMRLDQITFDQIRRCSFRCELIR